MLSPASVDFGGKRRRVGRAIHPTTLRRARCPYQFTILADWGNLSVGENFAGRKERIDGKTNVQPLWIVPVLRPREAHGR
jgi:hypothetical protein